jgi:hypothetical protein
MLQGAAPVQANGRQTSLHCRVAKQPVIGRYLQGKPATSAWPTATECSLHPSLQNISRYLPAPRSLHDVSCKVQTTSSLGLFPSGSAAATVKLPALMLQVNMWAMSWDPFPHPIQGMPCLANSRVDEQSHIGRLMLTQSLIMLG